MLLGLGTAVAADIYRWVDKNGNPVYSDQPTENAEKIELLQPMTYTPVQVPEDTSSNDAEDEQQTTDEESVAIPNYRVTIVSPENDAGIRVNNGNVTVNLQVIPALVAERGDLVQLYLNGLPAGVPMPQLSFTLEIWIEGRILYPPTSLMLLEKFWRKVKRSLSTCNEPVCNNPHAKMIRRGLEHQAFKVFQLLPAYLPFPTHRVLINFIDSLRAPK